MDAGILPEQIFCDGWSIGYDERFPQQRRVQQALMFARFSEHDNLYAHPLVNQLFIIIIYYSLVPRHGFRKKKKLTFFLR